MSRTQPAPVPVRPNPGSDEAIELGCTCAVLSNCHGRRMPPQGWTGTAGCPVHDPPDQTTRAGEEEPVG